MFELISVTLSSFVATAQIHATHLNAHELSGTLGVANKADSTALLIDLKTGQTRTFPVGKLPHEIAFGPDHAFVSNYGSAYIRSSDLKDEPGNTITAIQLSSPYKVSQIDLGASRCAPHGLAVSPDGHHLYATCEGRQEVAVVDLDKLQLAYTIRINQAGSHMIALSHDGLKAYVTNFWHGTVSVLDLVQKKLIKQIDVGRGCEGIGIATDDRWVYASRVEDNEIVKIDTEKLEVSARKSTAQGTAPIRVIGAPGMPGQILVNNVQARTLQILDGDTLELIREVKVGVQPIGIAASNGRYGFVANMKDDNVQAIDLMTGQTVAIFKAGRLPDGIAFTP
jgi:DNA-binding beta-propeller fold protein YncE